MKVYDFGSLTSNSRSGAPRRLDHFSHKRLGVGMWPRRTNRGSPKISRIGASAWLAAARVQTLFGQIEEKRSSCV
jgi:hypothetical protein